MRQKKVTTEEVFVKKDINFFEEVWAVVRLIPKGRVSSYGAMSK